MYFTVYRTVNKLNGKVYIGKHQTKDLDDAYMGSGKHLYRSIEKNGLHNFEKEILFIFETEAEMNAKEAELVTEAFCKEDTNYNLCPGGQGGWGYINNNKEITSKRAPKILKSANNTLYERYGVRNCNQLPQNKNKRIEKNKYLHKIGVLSRPDRTGMKNKLEHNRKIGEANSKHQKGSGNSMFGRMWITNGSESKSINKSDLIPEGWYKGRKIKNYVTLA